MQRSRGPQGGTRGAPPSSIPSQSALFRPTPAAGCTCPVGVGKIDIGEKVVRLEGPLLVVGVLGLDIPGRQQGAEGVRKPVTFGRAVWRSSLGRRAGPLGAEQCVQVVGRDSSASEVEEWEVYWESCWAVYWKGRGPGSETMKRPLNWQAQLLLGGSPNPTGTHSPHGARGAARGLAGTAGTAGAAGTAGTERTHSAGVE